MLELARAQDWEDVRRLSVQIHDLHAAWRPDIYFHADEPYPHENFLEDIAARRVYVAKAQERVVGYVVLSTMEKGGIGTVSQKLMRVDSICVDKNCRRQGIGRGMMTDVWALAKAFGCAKLLLSVHPENENAIVFYQKCGYSLRTINLETSV